MSEVVPIKKMFLDFGFNFSASTSKIPKSTIAL